MNILITAIGSFSADIAIKNLKKEGHYIIGCDIYPKEWIADAYNVDVFYQAPYATDEEKYITFMLEVIKKEKIHVLLPLTDVEVDVLNKNREKIEKENVIITISEKKVVERCRDKKDLTDFLSNKNICRTIPTQSLSIVKEENLTYPVVCKLTDGRSSQGLKYIYSADEMSIFKDSLSTEQKNQYIVQPYIEGSIITVDIVREKATKKTVAIARKELLRTLNGAGTSVYVFNDDRLVDTCVKIAESLDLNGCVNFEFIAEKGTEQKYFIECNPRFSGGIEFSCIAGYDFINNHLKCFMGENIEENINYKNQYIARKYEEYVTKIE